MKSISTISRALLLAALSAGLMACNTTADPDDNDRTEVSTMTTETHTTDSSMTHDKTMAHDSVMTQGKTIVTVTQENSDFSTLNQLLTQAGLTDTLNSGEYTVFAPTNAAFDAVPQETMNKLSQNPELLKEVLMYHVVANKVAANDVVTMTEAQPLRDGEGIMISAQGDTVMLNNAARVIDRDIMVDNGVVHVVDQVLIPGDLSL